MFEINEIFSSERATPHNPNADIATSLKQQTEIPSSSNRRNINNQCNLYFFRYSFITQILVKNSMCPMSDRQHYLGRSDSKQEIENFN